MTQPSARAGWYPDPSGRHQSRYFDGQWTQHVSTNGVNSIDPMTASPAPAAAAPVHTPYGPTGPGGPGTPPYLQSTASPGMRSPKIKLAIAGGVAAVAVGIAVALSLGGGGGSGGHGFCTDVAALGSEYPSKLSAADLKDGSKLSHIATQFDALAAESSSSQDATDLRYVASWLRKVARGNYAGAQDSQAQLVAASDRVTTYINDTCPGIYVGGS